MIPLTVDEIAKVLGAPLLGPGNQATIVTALTADSRTVVPGALFVALPGERVDGHDYVAAAAAAGAAAALTRYPIEGAPCLVVTDPMVALGRLSRYIIDRSSVERSARHRHHRFGRENLDQGSASATARAGRPYGSGGGQSQQ